MSTHLGINELRIALHCMAKSGTYFTIDPLEFEESIRSIIYQLNLTIPALLRKAELDRERG